MDRPMNIPIGVLLAYVAALLLDELPDEEP